MKRIFSILIVFIALIGRAYAQPDFTKLINHQWVDSVYRSLTPDERIAQLVWIAATSDDNITHQMNIAEMVRMIHPGGIIFFEGEVKRQIKLTNYYQSLSKTPLVIAMDAEWGPGMRLDNTISLPYAMALGAVQENALLVRSGEEIGRQLRRIGVHFNLAPDADINTEPLNPIIGMRSFGEVPEKVSQCALSMMQGMLKQRVIPVAKHFPGHGDTRNDSHLSLPVVPFDRERLDKVEFYPFKELIKSGLPAIMTAHLHVPALDSGQNIPASLSPIITNNLLRKEWGFKGLILTDAMNMGGVLSYGKPGLIDVLALKAGNDVIEFPADPKASIQAIKEALKSGQLSWKDIELKCRRVLAAKYWCGLNHYQPVNLANIDQELNTPESALLNRELSEASLTLIENKDNIIPLMNLDTLQIATLSIGTDSLTQFQKTLSLYSRADHYNLPDKFTKVQGDLMLKKLNKYNLVLVGVHNLYETAIRKTVKVGNIKHLKPERPYNVTAELEQFISVLSINKKTIFTLFGNPYALAEFKNFVRPNALLVSYQDNSNNEDLSAQLIFGGIKAKGKLPVSVTGLYTAGTGFTTPDPIRFKYTLPEEVGYDSQRITQKVDSIVTRALELKAFPGCQILVAKDRKVIFRKEYGYHTFDHTIPVKPDDIYDLASITKITGPLPAYIKLYDEGKFKFDDRFSNYWPDWKSRLFHKSNKEDLTFRELLAHQAGLVPYIAYWTKTMTKDKKPDPKWYSAFKDSTYSLPVTPDLFLNNKFRKNVYKQIRLSDLKTRGKYVYSCLSFILAPELIKNLSGENYVNYITENIYRPLGASIGYKPFETTSLDKIAPTEFDKVFRQRLVHGSVHDEAAAVLGGISGNAGLFASANDMAKLLQMYLQKGTYGGHQFFKESTFDEFNTVQFPKSGNRRALGFDKPLLNNSTLSNEDAYPIKEVSSESFGHSGFTGTFVWVDPKYNLVYVFLSNHIYPTRENTVLFDLNIRTSILKVFYNELKK